MYAFRHIAECKQTDKKPTEQPTPAQAVTQSKWSPFSKIFFAMTGECILAGSGPWLIPMVLLDRMPEHDSRNAIEVSLRADSPSQPPSFYLSLSIANITGDYRPFSYTVQTTLVSLLGYDSAILYSSCFPLYPAPLFPPHRHQIQILIT